MKWIGQHIYDFISRFRSDVYLEAIESGTIASGGNLGLDSNNKIVKAAEVGSSVDLTSEVTGVLPVANGGTGASTLADNSILTGTGTSAITAEADLTFTSNILTVSSSSSGSPNLVLKNTNTDDVPTTLNFYKTEIGTSNDKIGKIVFQGEDAGGGQHHYAYIQGSMADATAGAEAGKIELAVAEFDGGGGGVGTPTVGLTLDGDTNADGEVDVTIGAGTASTTTIAGKLDIDGDFITSAGALTLETAGNLILDPVSQQVECDAIGFTVSSSAAGPIISCINNVDDNNGANLYLANMRDGNGSEDDDTCGIISFGGEGSDGNPHNFAQISSGVIESQAGSERGNLRFKVAEYDGTPTTGLLLEGQDQDGEVDVTIGAGAASTTTIAGTLNANAWGFLGGTANALITDDGDGTVTSEAGATWDGGTLALTSADTGCAAITLTATGDGNKPTNFGFIKNRASSTTLTDDFIGMTSWISDNASGTAKTYAEQYVQAAGVVAGDEFARVTHTCATSTGSASSRQNMITGLGSASANTVNTTLGYGVASTCTIAGDVVLEGDQLRVSGSSTQSGRIALSEDTDNGTDLVTLAAPAATSGQTITLPDATGTVALNNKSYSFITCSFYDTLGSTLHYLPLSDTIGEQTSEGNTYTDWIAPCATTVKHVIIRFSNIAASKDVTLTVWKDPVGSGTKSSVEAETLTVGASNENDVHMWAFDSATIAKGEVLKISIQSDGSSITSSNCHAKVVLELDWDDMYSGSSQIFTS